MKKKIVMSVMLMTLMLGGCDAFKNPRVQLLASQKTFVAVVDSLTELYKADKISDEDAVKITKFVNTGEMALEIWKNSLLADKEDKLAGDEFEKSLNALIKLEKEVRDD